MNMMDAIQDTSSSVKGFFDGEESLISSSLLGEIHPMAVPYDSMGKHTVTSGKNCYIFIELRILT